MVSSGLTESDAVAYLPPHATDIGDALQIGMTNVSASLFLFAIPPSSLLYF